MRAVDRFLLVGLLCIIALSQITIALQRSTARVLRQHIAVLRDSVDDLRGLALECEQLQQQLQRMGPGRYLEHYPGYGGVVVAPEDLWQPIERDGP